MSAETSPEQVREELIDHLDAVATTLRMLDVAGGSDVPADILKPALDGVLTQAAAIDDERRNGGPRGDPRFDQAAPYSALLRDENVARAFLGLDRNARLADLEGSVRSIAAFIADPQAFARVLAPQIAADLRKGGRDEGGANEEVITLSEAARLKAKELGDRESAKLPLAKIRPVIAILGDLPVGEITPEHLQIFAEDFTWLPTSATRGGMPDADTIREVIAENKAAKGPRRGEKTVADHLNWLRGIIKEGCYASKIPYTLGERRVRVPQAANPPQRRRAPDLAALATVFRTGVSAGTLSHAMLGPLGYLAGRRIGLLADLHGQDIVQMHGVWVIIPSHTVVDESGNERRVPYKTDASLGAYVLHDFFAEIGFAQFAASLQGPVFSWLARARDPADAAQKQYSNLVDRSGAPRTLVGSFHWNRYGCIGWMKKWGVDVRVRKLQGGHEHANNDVHARYEGGLSPEEMALLSKLPLPDQIDWNAYRGLDWEALAAKRPVGGRKRKNLT